MMSILVLKISISYKSYRRKFTCLSAYKSSLYNKQMVMADNPFYPQLVKSGVVYTSPKLRFFQ